MMSTPRRFAVPALLGALLPFALVGCDSDSAGEPDTTAVDSGGTQDASEVEDVGTQPDIAAGESGLTWYANIAPLLETHCGACHVPGGQGTGDFTDPEVAIPFAPAILSSVADGRMPPPASDPDCHPYVNADRWVIPDDFINTIQAWLDDGAPLGDPESAVAVPPYEAELAEPDITIELPAAYTPTFDDPDNPGNEYRCFTIEHGQEEAFYVNALSPVIDQSALVHHIVLFKLLREDVRESEWDPSGYDCIDRTFIGGSGGAAGILNGDSGMISAWAPGSQAVRFSDGAAIRVEPDQVFVMQVHYFDGAPGEQLSDRSGYAFETVEDAETQVLMIPFGPNRFRIPPGAEAHPESQQFSMPLNLSLHGVMPHMHYLGQSYRMWLESGDDETCIVESDDYDFENQLTYMFEEPIPIPAGADIGFACTWNNSTSNPNLVINPPTEIRYGERTDEEMCYGFALVSLGN